MCKRICGLVAIIMIQLIFASTVPKMLNYQAKLTDTDGVALEGNYDITFRIYDVESGGTPLWAEAHSGINSVPVVNGLFDVILGSITTLDIAFDDTYWIELEVEGEILSPREPLVSTPYAFRSIYANSATYADTAVYADTAYIISGGAIQTDGISITGDGTETDPLSATLGNTIETEEITDGTILESDLNVSNYPTDGYVLTYNSGSGGFLWSEPGGSGTGQWEDDGTGTYARIIGNDNIRAYKSPSASYGIYAIIDNAGIGIYGKSTDNTGVTGVSTNGVGVVGSGGYMGVWGSSPIYSGYFSGGGCIKLPVKATTGDPAGVWDVGAFYFNSADEKLRLYDGTSWTDVGGSGTGQWEDDGTGTYARIIGNDNIRAYKSTSASYGIYAYNSDNPGVYGSSTNSVGVYGSSANVGVKGDGLYGLVGYSSTYPGYFYGGGCLKLPTLFIAGDPIGDWETGSCYYNGFPANRKLRIYDGTSWTDVGGNQNIFSKLSDGSNVYNAASTNDSIKFVGSGGISVSVNSLNGSITIDGSSVGGSSIWIEEPTLSRIYNSNADTRGERVYIYDHGDIEICDGNLKLQGGTTRNIWGEAGYSSYDHWTDNGYIGFKFTPNVDMTVTKARALWAGDWYLMDASFTVLAGPITFSDNGVWQVQALPTPVNLTAGNDYWLRMCWDILYDYPYKSTPPDWEDGTIIDDISSVIQGGGAGACGTSPALVMYRFPVIDMVYEVADGTDGHIAAANAIRTGATEFTDYNHFGSGGVPENANDDAADVYIEDELEVDGGIYSKINSAMEFGVVGTNTSSNTWGYLGGSSDAVRGWQMQGDTVTFAGLATRNGCTGAFAFFANSSTNDTSVGILAADYQGVLGLQIRPGSNVKVRGALATWNNSYGAYGEWVNASTNDSTIGWLGGQNEGVYAIHTTSGNYCGLGTESYGVYCNGDLLVTGSGKDGYFNDDVYIADDIVEVDDIYPNPGYPSANYCGDNSNYWGAVYSFDFFADNNFWTFDTYDDLALLDAMQFDTLWDPILEHHVLRVQENTLPKCITNYEEKTINPEAKTFISISNSIGLAFGSIKQVNNESRKRDEKLNERMDTKFDFGIAELKDRKTWIPFSAEFTSHKTIGKIIVTVTPIVSVDNPITVVKTDENGFWVEYTSYNGTPVSFNWIAIAKVDIEMEREMLFSRQQMDKLSPDNYPSATRYIPNEKEKEIDSVNWNELKNKYTPSER